MKWLKTLWDSLAPAPPAPTIPPIEDPTDPRLNVRLYGPDGGVAIYGVRRLKGADGFVVTLDHKAPGLHIQVQDIGMVFTSTAQLGRYFLTLPHTGNWRGAHIPEYWERAAEEQFMEILLPDGPIVTAPRSRRDWAPR